MSSFGEEGGAPELLDGLNTAMFGAGGNFPPPGSRQVLAGDGVRAVVFRDLRAARDERRSGRVAQLEVLDAGTSRRKVNLAAGGQVTDVDDITAGV